MVVTPVIHNVTLLEGANHHVKPLILIIPQKILRNDIDICF